MQRHHGREEAALPPPRGPKNAVRDALVLGPGLGQLPLIEVPDTSNYTLPSRDEVEREICSRLGECITLLVTANNPQQLEVILKGAWKDFTLHPKPINWPAYPGPLEVEPVGGE